MKYYLLPIILLFTVSCDSTDWTDVGYSDGYAVGFNTTCNIRATLVEGKWDNDEYMAAYNYGYADGATACRMSK
ncbi:MAG: hypothetical protein ACR2PE_05080 [Porticoccus sp.]